MSPKVDSCHPTTMSMARLLALCQDASCPFELHIVRYHHKTGRFHSRHPVCHDHLLLFVERGSLRLDHRSQAHRLEGGDLIWVPPGEPRELRSTWHPTESRHYNIRFQLRQGQRLPRLDPAAQLFREAWPCLPLIQLLHDCYGTTGRFRATQARSLVTSLLSLIAELLPSAGGPQALSYRQRRQLQQLLVRRADHGLRPGDLATELGLSLDYFTRLFTATYGCPPRRYLRDYVMRLAAERLLDDDRSIALLAEDMGFSTASFFCRQFRQVLGCSPGQYRRREGR